LNSIHFVLLSSDIKIHRNTHLCWAARHKVHFENRGKVTLLSLCVLDLHYLPVFSCTVTFKLFVLITQTGLLLLLLLLLLYLLS